MDEINHGFDMIDRGLGHNSVAKVKDMARAPIGFFKDSPRVNLSNGRWRAEEKRIEISLDGIIVPDAQPRM